MVSSENSKLKANKRKVLFPIRVKILVTLLILITASIGTITFTMANLFHNDKSAYIRDLTSLIAMHTAQETNATLTSYQEALYAFARLMYDQKLSQRQKSSLLTGMFEDFPDFISVTLTEKKRGNVTVYDANQLVDAELTQEILENYRQENPLPLDEIFQGNTYVSNSTISKKLPTLTIAVYLKFSEHDNPAIISGLIRLDKLLKIASRSNVYETFLVDIDGTPLAHTVPQVVTERVKVDWIPDLAILAQGLSAGTTLQYDYQSTTYIGGFAPVGFGKLIAAVQIPESAAYLTAQNLLNDLLGVALALLCSVAFAGLIWSHRISKPIKSLANATDVIGQGDFDTQVQVRSRDEIGYLADSFNRMASGLKQRDEALEKAQTQLVQSEKMSVFGTLSAGIAHEVKNPLAGILGYTQLSLSKIEQDHEAHEYLSVIEKETKRCNSIIENLMTFARQQDQEKLKNININQIVDYSIATVNHQLLINNIIIEKQLESRLPSVLGNANQIQQVLINLMINAQQAIGDASGKLIVSTKTLNNEYIEIRVIDNGPGMTAEIQEHIFEPFFTTKPAGKGTGLGMSVSYGIIQDHNGEISVESAPEEGAMFIIKLPISKEVEKNESISRLTLN